MATKKGAPSIKPVPWLPTTVATSPFGGSGGDVITQAGTSGSSAGGGASQGAVSNAAASGMFVVQFGVVDLAASLSASKLYRAVPGSASVVGRQIPFRTAFRGYVAGMSLTADAAKSAGSAVFELFKNGVATGGKLTWSNGANQQAAPAFEKSLYGFSANEDLDVRVTTDGSFLPITVDLLIDLYLVASIEAATV